MSKECRICLAANGEMIAPCRCSGTSKWVHRECLDKWRSTSTAAFRTCSECKFKYHLEQVPYRGAVSQECAFWLLIARDMAATVISMLLVAAALGGIAYAADTRGGKHGHRALRNAVFPSHMSDPAAYCLIGLVLWLAAAGLCFLASLVFCSGETCTDQPVRRGDGGCCSRQSSACDPCMCCYPMQVGGANQCCCFYVGGPGTCNQGPDGCGGSCGGHHNCGNDCGGGHHGNGGGEALMLILVIFIVVLVAIGLVAIIWMIISISASVTRRHMHVLERRMNTKLQRVVDLNGVDFSIFAAETSPHSELVDCQPRDTRDACLAMCSADLDANMCTDAEESPLLSATCSSEL